MKRLLTLIPILIAGCVSTQSLPVEDRSRVYDLDYDLVFDAAVQILAEEGYAIIDAEKEEGIINTDYRAEDRLLSWISGPTRRKVSALVSTAPNGTKILVNFDLQEFVDQSFGLGFGDRVYRSKPISPQAARRYYRDFFNRLEEYLDNY